MILICGATGNIGGEAVLKLVEGGHRVRAMSRDPARARLPSAVEVVQADLSKPETLDRALAGVEKALLVAGAQELPGIARSFAAAAVRAGLRHVVLNSSGTIEMPVATAIGKWHLEAENVIRESGLAFTFLRPGNFNTNSLRWAGMIKSQGTVFAPGGDGASAPIDPKDIGRVAAVALSTAGHEGKTYTLTGPEALTARQQVEQIGAAIGRSLKFVEVPEAGARTGMLKSGMPEVMVNAIMELIAAGRAGGEGHVNHVVREVTGREPGTFAQWARDNASAFR
jgi:uncharacterized protein YbjT (DUF2867 family)